MLTGVACIRFAEGSARTDVSHIKKACELIHEEAMVTLGGMGTYDHTNYSLVVELAYYEPKLLVCIFFLMCIPMLLLWFRNNFLFHYLFFHYIVVFLFPGNWPVTLEQGHEPRSMASDSKFQIIGLPIGNARNDLCTIFAGGIEKEKV